MAETRIARGLAYIAAAGMLAVTTAYAYWRAFSTFAAYDDEGYILASVGSYLEGHRLYEEVFTQYGPAFYVLESVLHQTLRAPLTHDVERFVTAGIWVATSATCAATVRRLTRSWTLAALTLAGVFIQLTTLVSEPGHPQGLLVLAITLVTLMAAEDLGGGRGRMSLTVAGVLTAFALLVKINVGAYLALGFAVPLLFSTRLPRARITTLLLAGMTAIACVLPLVATKDDVRGWALNYALVTSLSLASTIVVIASTGRGSLPWGVAVRYTLTTAAACVLLLLPALVRGTSIPSLVTGLVVRPSQFADLFQIPLVLSTSSVLAAGAGLAVSVAFVASVRLRCPPPAIVVGIAKIAVAGFGLWLWSAGPVSLLASFTPLLWVVAVAPGDDSIADRGVGRSVLALVAVFESLQAYPVAGSQLAFATFLMIPAAFVCAHDGFGILARHSASARVWPWVAQASFVLTGFLLYRPFVDPQPWRAAYDAGYEMRLNGAERLRLPAGYVALYQWLSGTVAAHCGALLTLPGLNSFNAWSGIDAVSERNATAWMTLLSGREQASIWTAIDRANRPCMIYSPGLANNWLGGGSIEALPAYREMTARFRQVAEHGGYQLLMREKDVPRPGPIMALLAGRQAFERRRSPIPIRADLAVAPSTSTLRAWIRSRRTGVIVGCQTFDYRLPSSHWLPLLYIGQTGRLRGQHWTAGMQGPVSAHAVNDGNWHHVALVKEQNNQRLYVDGSLVGASSAQIETRGLSSCQAGTGNTSFWPDGPRAAMPFNGEIEGLGVSLRAWSAAEVADDWRTTQPRE